MIPLFLFDIPAAISSFNWYVCKRNCKWWRKKHRRQILSNNQNRGLIYMVTNTITYFFNSDRHLELIDFFNVCFNGECYNRFTFNNGTACHNQNNHDVIWCWYYILSTIACMVNLGSSNSLRVVTKQAIMIVFMWH